jgi:hypothetical protein
MIKIIIIKKETFSDMSDQQILEDSLNDKEKMLFKKCYLVRLYNYQYSLLKQMLMRILITFLNWLFISSKDRY